ncbi:MAG: hypothetical protein HYU75_25265, partial [Betaproteobacteria bacterium]|nr:hypothetical protein [Betaproteobacteria bacterium]
NILLEGMRQNSTIVLVPSSAMDTMGLGAMAGMTSMAMQLAEPHGAKSVATQSRGGAMSETVSPL